MSRFNSRKSESKGPFKAPVNVTPNPETLPPTFCLALMNGTGGCLSYCTQEEKAAFAETLRKLSQQKWSEIRQRGKHKGGFEPLPRHTFKIAIPLSVTEDVTILAFRFYGKAPMLGFNDRGTFRIFWLDREFKAYDHG